jgi:hypothetical protein
MANEDDVRPWDRQPGETDPAYAAFAEYRDMGGARSTAAVAQKLGKSKTLTDRWSSKYAWVERTRAWDSMPARMTEKAYEDMAREIAEDHRRIATKLLHRLETGMDSLPEGKTPSQTWTMAHGAARQGHQFAADLSKPKDAAKDEITKRIQSLLEALAGDA